MTPADVEAVLAAVMDSRRRTRGETGGYAGDYAQVVRTLARRSDVTRELIDSLLHPFSWDDLDPLDAEFDSGLRRIEYQFGVGQYALNYGPWRAVARWRHLTVPGGPGRPRPAAIRLAGRVSRPLPLRPPFP